jgi:DNA-binding LytR/AlgR family response regulator
MERVRPERRGTLLALKAEGHYLQVYTDAGSDLILYRLSDALLEVGAGDGAQVHRSWWVASSALSPQRHRDRLVLTNGIEVPVSRSFRVAARQRGWLSPADPGFTT